MLASVFLSTNCGGAGGNAGAPKAKVRGWSARMRKYPAITNPRLFHTPMISTVTCGVITEVNAPTRDRIFPSRAVSNVQNDPDVVKDWAEVATDI